MTHTVTYSCEDDKIRLYVGRVPRADYDALRAAGFVATPKQDCDFAAVWTPEREDLAREFLEDGEDVGDEDYSPQERAADRAERFGGYRDKRATEAGAGADAFEAGPAAFGHQSRARAERQATRHDRKRVYAVSQWAKAEYWQERTRGVIAHALYKSSAAVRRSRILRLEAEQRKHDKGREEYATRYAAWVKAPALDGADFKYREGLERDQIPAAYRLAYSLANTGGGSWDYQHPRNPDRKTSLYSLLTDEADPITPAEAAALWLDGKRDPADPEGRSARWSAHYANRLDYERAMLAAEGGTAGDAEMECGGWIGRHQIHKVNKSPVTGRVVSVTLKYPGDRWGRTSEGHHMRAFNVERLPEGAYRAPTAEELEAFQATTKARKAKEKAEKPAAPSLINPTDADAERLQALWNAKARAAFEEWKRGHYGYGEFEPTAVRRMTQEQYSALSKGAYARCETSEVCAHGHRPKSQYGQNVDPVPVALKVRTTYGGTNWTGGARAVIVITDKPRKALPLDWAAVEAGDVPTATEAKPEAVAV